MKNLIWIIIAVAAIVGLYYLIKGNDQVETPSDSDNVEIIDQNPESEVEEFTIIGENFKFSLGEIRVRKGNTIKINFKSAGGTHDWRVDEFNASTSVLSSGEEETVEFVADQVGTFEYYCSIGNHRAMGMKGNLIVEE